WERKPDGVITLQQEAGIQFVRLVSQEPNQLVLISQTVPVPADFKGLVVQARFRTANVKFGKDFLCDARARFSFVDAAGQPVGKGPGDVIFNANAKVWTDIERKFLVPEGAAAIKVNVCLNRPASGTLDLDAIRLSPMDEKEAAALAQVPLLAQQKKAADEAEVARLLQLPSVSRELKVSGNKLVNDQGRTVILQGVNVPSLEWSARGEQVNRSAKVALVDWKANVIRVPVANSYWFGRGKGVKEPANDADAYRRIVDDLVKIAAGQGAYVILDLHLFGGPQANAVEFWKDAAARYANNPAVLFDLFNEPTGITWDLWQKGGPKEVTDKKTKEVTQVEIVGMQALIDTVRSTGARNIVIAGGMGFAYDLSGVLEGHALTESGGNGLVYATHFYNWHRGWEKRFLPLAAKYPILVGEFGADVKKMNFIPANQQENPLTWMPDALGMIQKYQLNWTAFSFHPAASPVLIKDWTYEPTPFFGAFVKDALAGKKFESVKLR
ncbi:MAG TPA: cellulase family glycosylhydrolase, partial [Rariglobus sp.]|nr:cellulase family glycosylhydrolase [Rariglobus sp.]